MTNSICPGTGQTRLERDLRVPPESRVNLFKALLRTLALVACKLDITSDIVRRARPIALRHLFANDRLLQEEPDFRAIVCGAIGEAKAAGSTTQTPEPSEHQYDQFPKGKRRACSDRCVLASLGRVWRRISTMEKLLLGLESHRLTESEAALVLGVPETEIPAMRARITKAMSALWCEHVKLAFPEESEPRT